MIDQTGSEERLDEWTPELREAAKGVIVDVLDELPSGDNYDLASRVVERLAASWPVPLDEDALADGLQPFELLDCVDSVYAEDGSVGFMGPSWCEFSAYEVGKDKHLVVENRIEAGGYEVYGSASSLSEASRLMRAGVIDRLGSDCYITLADGSTIALGRFKEDEPDDDS